LALETLNLGRNRLGSGGGCALARLISEFKPPLRELSIEDNALGDTAVEKICDALSSRCLGIVGLGLSKNDIGFNEKTGTAIGNLIGSAGNLQMLDLHWNNLHGVGAAAVMQGLYDNAQQKYKLMRVNVAWNRLGARCTDSTKHKVVVSPVATKGIIAECKCEACRGCMKVVSTLASVFSDGDILFHLDISYNGLCADDMQTLADGIKGNFTLFGLHVTGNEATVDDVGFIIPQPPGKGSENEAELERLELDNPEQAKLLKEEYARQRGELVDREKVRLGINDCVRHTPRRLRLDRLAHFNKRATNDGVGAGPLAEKQREMSVAASRTNPSLQHLATADAFSDSDLDFEKEWIGVQSKVVRCGDFGQRLRFEDVRLNERCCWICENWVQEVVSYYPGWSGPEQSFDEVDVVFAYFSIDGFTRPTRLTKTEEKYVDRKFSLKLDGKKAPKKKQSSLGVELVRSLPNGDERKPLVNDKGRYVVWRGNRMLPPSTQQMNVVFQVNNSIKLADHMTRRPLPVARVCACGHVFQESECADDEQTEQPIDMEKDQDNCPSLPTHCSKCKAKRLVQQTVVVHHDGKNNKGHGGLLPPIPLGCGKKVELLECNIIRPGANAWSRFEKGLANAICLMEDCRSELEVVPRRLQYEKKTMVFDETWSFENSIFKDYTRASDKVYDSLFDYDWSCSKLEKYLEKYVKCGASTRESICNFLRKSYRFLVAAYHGCSFKNFQLKKSAAGLMLLQFTEILSHNVAEGEPDPGDFAPPLPDGLPPSRGRTFLQKQTRGTRTIMKQGEKSVSKPSTVFNANFHTSDADTIFIGANVIDKENPVMKTMTELSPGGLARFQWLEAFVRVAIMKYTNSTDKQEKQTDAASAVQELANALNIGRDHFFLRHTLQNNLFSEECCLLLRQQKRLIESTFFGFAKRCRYPGRSPNRMAYPAWLDFLNAAGACEFGLSKQNFGTAFALGKEIRLDEYTSMRHMELSWIEFIVAIGAVVRLSGDFHPDSFPDMLMEFVEENISIASQSLSSRSRSRIGARYTHDPAIAEVLNLVCQVFLEATEDTNGTLSQMEFSRVMRQRNVAQGLKDAGIHIDDIKVLFHRLDADGSGSITIDELCEGFVDLKKAMVGVDRAVAYLRKVFEEADMDKSGFLDKEEFRILLNNPGVILKLQSVGINRDEIDDIWATVDLEDHFEVTPESMVAGFLQLRDPNYSGSRGINFLRQVFKAADVDNSGDLSREEIEALFTQDAVLGKLQKLGLESPDWLEIFDIIDLNGDQVISWHEMSKGMLHIWGHDSAFFAGRQPSASRYDSA